MGDLGPNGEMSGAEVMLLVNSGTDVSPVFSVVGSQRGVKFDESNGKIDISSKNSRDELCLPGRYSCSASLETLYVPDDVAYQALRTAVRAGTLIKVRRQELGLEVEEADALITKMSEDYPDNEAATIALEMFISGGWTELGS